MTPLIALDLSLDGIAVLSRADGGVWWREGVVRLDSPDMDEGLARLRARCAARVGEDFTSILIIPESQMLFTSLERDDRDPKVTIRSLLHGRTPYEVEDLTFDYVQRGDRLQVAVVALETLMEAEEFAAGFGFRPVAIMGDPGDAAYPGRPYFGQTGIASEFLDGARLVLDVEADFEVIPAPSPPKPASEDAPEPVEDPAETEIAAGPSPDTTEEPETANVLPEVKAMPAAPTPVLPTSVAPAPEEGSQPESFEEALAAAETPDTTAPEGEPESAATPPAEPKPQPVMPAFSTQRRGQPSLGSKLADPSLTRIEPRLAAPIAPEPPKSADPAETKAGPTKPLDAPPSHQSDKTPRAPDVSEAASTSQPPAPLVTPPDTASSKPAVPNPDTRSNAPTGNASGTPVEDLDAVALSLPGLAREKAIQPRRSGTARLGLYLTLSLLALMGVIAIWSVMAKDPPTTGASEDTGLVHPPEETIIPVPNTTIVRADPPVDQGIESLLPPTDSSGSRTANSDVVSPPLPITTTEMPEQSTASEMAAIEEADEPTVVAPEDDQTAQTDAIAEPDVPETIGTAGNFEEVPSLAEAPAVQDGEELIIASVDTDRPIGEASPLPPAVAPDDAPISPTSATPSTVEAGNAPDQTVEPDPPTETAAAPNTEGDVTIGTEETAEPLVPPSAEGTLAPGGYAVISGRPNVLPVPRAEVIQTETDATPPPEDDAARAELRRTRPVQRPGDILAEAAEPANPPEETAPPMASGFTREELTRTRPSQRPESITDAAAAETLEAARAAAEERAAAVEAAAAAAVASLANQATVGSATGSPVTSASRFALPRSDRPRSRPRSVEREAARIVTSRRAQTSPAPEAASTTSAGSEETVPTVERSGQTIRSAGGSVARAATQQNAIRLREINLVGIYGRPNARRALVRLSNGRYVKVEVGDRLDRGRVTAIGESQLVYQRGGRTVRLRLPNS